MSPPPADLGRGGWPALVLCICFGVLVWPAILSGRGGTSEYWDQRNYHEPVIRAFAEQWPRVDLVNYRSATSPGYHLGLAILSRYVTHHQGVLQLVSSLFSLGFVLTVWWYAARGVGGWRALALSAPLLASSYLLSGAIWLTTDNAAWLFVALALGGVAHRALTPGRAIVSGVHATIATFIRQIHVWLAGPIAVAALFDRPRSGGARIAVAIAVMLPIALVAVLFLLWKGLMPPAYVSIHNQGANPALIPFSLALLGAYGLFFVPAFGLRTTVDVLKKPMTWLIALGVFAICASVPTAHSEGAGRWGGSMWELVRRMPVVADRSMVIPPMAAAGALVLCLARQAAANAGRTRAATVLLVALGFWAAAQSMNSQAWQRYSDPIILMSLAWFASLAPLSRAGWIGPGLLALVQFALSIITVYRPMAHWPPSP